MSSPRTSKRKLYHGGPQSKRLRTASPCTCGAYAKLSHEKKKAKAPVNIPNCQTNKPRRTESEPRSDGKQTALPVGARNVIERLLQRVYNKNEQERRLHDQQLASIQAAIDSLDEFLEVMRGVGESRSWP
jgi:hypothetical protein